jgi:hypothetical protein
LCREEVSQMRLNSIRGISNHDRLDEELYQDHETEEAKKARFTAHFTKRCVGHRRQEVTSSYRAAQKRLVREAKELEKLEKTLAKVALRSSMQACKPV